MISFPPQKEDFLPLVVNGKQVPPKISLEIQKRIRDTCRLAGIDAETVVGLPPLPEIKMPKHYLAKGSKREIEKVKRDIKIAENMAQMDKRIKQYREDRKLGKLAKKPELPF